MPVLPRPTSLMTTYLPIFSGILRGAALGGGLDLGAGADMTREFSETARQDTVSVLSATVMHASAASGVAVRSVNHCKQVLFPEMIVAGMRELHHVPVLHDHCAGRAA